MGLFRIFNKTTKFIKIMVKGRLIAGSIEGLTSKDRLKQAKADWRAQRMKLPVGDKDTFIPLPE